MENETIEIFRKEMDATGLSVSPKQIDQFSSYYDLLVEWNSRINLTRITEPVDVCRLHFMDSIAPMRFVSFEERSLIDIGTGAGFPGIPLKIMNPSLKLTLLDALDKRCRFLKEVTDSLGLDNVTIIHGRAEDAASGKLKLSNNRAVSIINIPEKEKDTDVSLRGRYDFATSRAVAKLNILCEYAVPFLKTGGRFVAYKSLDENNTELGDAGKAMQILGAVCERHEDYSVPGHATDRTLYFILKEKETPEKYPRRAGLPDKKPL